MLEKSMESSTKSMESSTSYVLAVDIGNSQTVLAVYPGPRSSAHGSSRSEEEGRAASLEHSRPPSEGQPIVSWRIATSSSRTVDETVALLHSLFSLRHLDPARVRAVAIGSVVPPVEPAFAAACRELFTEASAPLMVRAEHVLRAGVRIDYPHPNEIGIDRLLNSVAVLHRFGAPAVVVDFGTAITFDVVAGKGREGAFVGGVIAPGLVSGVEALFHKTARLPKVELSAPPGPIGRSTVEAIQAGIVLGAAAQVEGIVARIARALGLNHAARLRVIATGGLASLVAAHTGVIDTVEPFLTLEGLYLVHLVNQATGGQ
ncbi:MAG TPA: type III pantothenate kinase [Firmicutes bacterium]|nr:type III pantothenate kinase [Bacillota bacterium]